MGIVLNTIKKKEVDDEIRMFEDYHEFDLLDVNKIKY